MAGLLTYVFMQVARRVAGELEELDRLPGRSPDGGRGDHPERGTTRVDA
jgi:hypothetical protein